MTGRPEAWRVAGPDSPCALLSSPSPPSPPSSSLLHRLGVDHVPQIPVPAATVAQSPASGNAQTMSSPTQLTTLHNPFNSVENFLKSCAHFSTFIKGRILIKYYFCFDN